MGDRDQFFPVEIPFELYKSVPDSYLWIMPNTDHAPIARDPEAFRRTTLEFLQGKWKVGD